MKYVQIILLFFVSNVTAESEVERCPLPELNKYAYSDLDCQFYLGTKAYRADVYKIAAAHWDYVINSDVVYEGDEELQSMAFSNLNFLIYEGLGLKEDKDQAVRNWKKAVKEGNFEARRHLGTAYRDVTYKNKDHIKSYAWYLTVIDVASQNKNNDKYDKETIQHAKDGIQTLEEVMSKNQLNEAKILSSKLLTLK